MSGEQHEARTVFVEALALNTPAERARYLEKACRGKPELRQRVEALLYAHEQANDFLEADGFEYDGIMEGPGAIIDRYKLLAEIGEGGFGVVFMAEQLEPIRRRVALKIVKPGMDSKQVIARFEAERQALALMDHPNIAHVYDAGATESGRPYFVMELVRGVSITQYCDENKLSPAERLKLFIPVCDAVQHAHQKGIIHRDLKPSNILVSLHDEKPVPKVIDFGTAKALLQPLTDRTMFTAYGKLVGTPQYMSPEQAEMSGVDVDTRSDIYSLGVLLYELLTGTTPFEIEQLRSAAFNEMMRIIRQDDPPIPSSRISTLGARATDIAHQRQIDPGRLTRSLRGDLDWVVMKALEKDRTRRYDSAKALAVDLECYNAGKPVSAVPPSYGYRARKFIRRHPFVIPVAVVTVLLMLASVAEVAWQMATRPKPFSRSGKPLLAELHGHEAPVTSLAYSSQLNLLASASYDGTIRLWDSDTGVLRKILHGHGGRVWAVAVSPDGTLLASAGNDQKILLWDAKRGKVLRVFEQDAVPAYPDDYLARLVSNIAFSPDGRMLAAAGKYGDSINLWDVETGELINNIGFNGPQVYCLKFSPDGNRLAFTAGIHLGMLDVGSGTRRWWQHGDHQSADALAFTRDGKILIAGHGDQRVRYWDANTGKLMAQLPEYHAEQVSAVVVSPDGKTLACGSKDMITIWDTATETLLARFRAHATHVTELLFYDDSRTLVSGSVDRDVKVWDVPSEIALFRKGDTSNDFVELARAGRMEEMRELVRSRSKLSYDASSQWEGLGCAAAYASEWDVAIYAFEQACAMEPDNNVFALSLAIVYLQTGQEEEYARVSHTLLSLAEEVPSFYVTERAAKAALLRPVNGPDFDDACRLADSLVEPPYAGNDPWAMLAKSLAEYRRGNFASAIKWAGQVHVVGRDECIAAADFIMSACHSSLGDTELAQESFSEGNQVMELPRSIKYCVDMFWRDWLMAERFRDEAATLLGPDVAHHVTPARNAPHPDSAL